MCTGRSRRGRTQLSTLVRPFGQTKTLPLVVHTAGFTVYEEPCLAIIHMHVTKVCKHSYPCTQLCMLPGKH